jgi:cation-transporting ATPase I
MSAAGLAHDARDARDARDAAHHVRVVHALRGRLRVHLGGWGGKGQRRIERFVRAVPGVRAVQANPHTGNVLVHYDPAQIDEVGVLEALHALWPRLPDIEAEAIPKPHRPTAHARREGDAVRARITVRGLDRDPHLAAHVVERLRHFPGVRARANPLTGRVLVEFAQHEVQLDDLIAEVADVELPETPGEDHPADPLDPAPLIQSLTRAGGAALGLGLLVAQRLPGVPQPLVASTVPANIAGVIGILRGFPVLREGLRRLFGRNAADVALSVPNIVTLALSNSVLGVAVTGTESVLLLNEVRARQAAWRRYEDQLQNVGAATPGAVVRLESGETTPLSARVVEGFGTYVDRSARPAQAVPGKVVPAGARLFGGPFVLEMQANDGFAPRQRPAPRAPTPYDRYSRAAAPASLAYALFTAALTRSLGRTFAALLLVNPRVAVIGLEAATLDASTRMLRSGVVVGGTRPERMLRRPDVVLLDGPRLIADRFETTTVAPLVAGVDTTELLTLAGGVAAAAGSPWAGAFRAAVGVEASEGHFDGAVATARIQDVAYNLAPLDDDSSVPEAAAARDRGDFVLQLTRAGAPRPLGLIALRPRLSAAVRDVVAACRRLGVSLVLLPGPDTVAARAVGNRAGIAVLDGDDALRAIGAHQARGRYVVFVADGADAGQAFDACDLAIGLTDGRNPLAARADLLAPDLAGVAAVVEAGVRRDVAVRDAVGVSAAANVAGVVWGIRGAPGIGRASTIVYGAALAALADGWWRLRGGERARPGLTHLTDPHPERWGARGVESTLDTLHTRENGLTTAEALTRRHRAPPMLQRRSLPAAALEQLRSPLAAILGAGAAIALLLGAPGDVAIVGLTLGANAVIGAWQERRASQVTETLNRLGAAKARVLRDGRPALLPAGEVVAGDVLLLSPGDRITADARLIAAQALTVDEAALTGESLPVLKAPEDPSAAARVVLDGSDVTTGSGRAVAFAVGRDTRMGSITAALAAAEAKDSPLERRLGQLVGQVLPPAVAAGALVTGAGWLRTRALLPQLAVGASIALSAVPEGLPLLTKISEAGVARRLADRAALTRRLPAVEALGRVDVACTDKTGTLTQGRLTLRLIAGAADDTRDTVHLPLASGQELKGNLRAVLRAAALASPDPTAAGAAAHPTDVAVIAGADAAGLGAQIRVAREAELPFDPARAFHVSIVDHRLYAKGAPEELITRCSGLRRPSSGGGETHDEPLDDVGRERLLARAETFAAEGLRVLLVAEGVNAAAADDGRGALDDPRALVALGFVGISDPLKPGVPASVRRCREAGVRVVMLTGDHPSTARAVAREAGLLDAGHGDGSDGAVLTGAEIAHLHNGDLDIALERARVIARATPLDKVRIVESLQRRGHTVAMSGDGVNDAPALRLADVGVAMGRGGTEVARQTADVVLADDDFSTLVEALVEGRSFWHNIRRALGLLLGGNLGELGLVVGATGMGLATPMTARQILVVNMITDVLPGLAVALQQPEHRRLASLAREGASALDRPLVDEVIRRGALTAGPSLAAYALSHITGGTPAAAQTVAFGGVVATQLAQTLDVGWSDGHLTPPIVGAIGGSAALTASAIALPPLRQFLGLAVPGPVGWGLIGGSVAAAIVLSRVYTPPEPAAASPEVVPWVRVIPVEAEDAEGAS